MKIIADTATLYSPAEGAQLGLTVIPVGVAIDNNAYRDYEEITSAELLRRIAAGGVPSSSQPSVGDVLDIFEKYEEELLFLTVGDGLSGAYQTAMGARSCAAHSERIHVVDSKTLAGPLRYLAQKALALAEQGMDAAAAEAALAESIESSMSFVIPADFEFLKRSGRLTPLAAKLGGTLRLLPVLTQTEDKKRIMPLGVRRTWRTAAEVIIRRLTARGVDENWRISVCHAGTSERAEEVRAQIGEQFPRVESELLELSPALITHGGPGCVVVQAIRK